ncbi:DUF3570 domain-containing protein [Methylomonas albis]|uniref:DUF3570 domain-containing protein n=1 Tax=Methylomonas albis TaxID=1854563 RepID=A0ABR9D1I5_9GAMM|nr:DUF3570 domain-containing protein [Methylomonas albis]MBD9356880.1 DUF3570 domain-containing protein [Methylomonas albis]
MAVTSSETRTTLAALTSAALSLPGMHSQAAVPSQQPNLNLLYGHYQESNDRMQVDVYHVDFSVPFADRIEMAFSLDRDTYSGASPAYSVPDVMTNQPKFTLKTDGSSASNAVPVDIVTAASSGITASGLTTIGGLNNFQEFVEGRSANDQPITDALVAWTTDHPKPASATLAIGGTLDFQEMAYAAYYGSSNTGTGSCSGQGTNGCYEEANIVVGHVNDGTLSAHLHQFANDYDSSKGIDLYGLEYHADSSGIYLRALDGSAFSLDSLNFNATIQNGNRLNNAVATTSPNYWATPYWEMLGFNTAVNTNLASGDGTNYATRIAYQTIANGFNGNLSLADGTLNSSFSNVNAVWIHFAGFPSTPTNGKTFNMVLDNVVTSSSTSQNANSDAMNAWLLAKSEFEADIVKNLTIAVYQSLLNKITPTMQPVQRYQQQPLETRTMPTFSGKYYFDNATLGFSGGLSEEPDFVSTFGSVNYSREFNNKLTTLTAGYNLTSNQITRNTDTHSGLSEAGHVHASDPTSPNYPALTESSVYNSFSVGLSQVLAKNTLFQSTANFTHQEGYLSNPYKYVYIRGEVTAAEYYALSQQTNKLDWSNITKLEMVGTELFREVRPDQRNMLSFSNRINQHIPALNASSSLDYRFYTDDWSINSHTVELKWYQSLPFGITVTPGLRYYSQSQADFFAPYFLAPRADGHYSSDFRLADFGSLSGSIAFSKQLSKGIKLEAGVEYYTRQSDLKLGGGNDTSYADYSYYMVHAGMNINLYAPASQKNEHESHQSHLHHGAPLPAGVMFGHMMTNPGEFMVGYRYQYANQSGNILRGSNVVADTSLLTAGCGNNPCASRPREMSMNMHMLDIMYAPTDWLNLMVMPQIMDMKMSSSPIVGATTTDEHSGGHSSGGLSDTTMAALLKLYDHPDHRIHLGLGFSAPTGDVEATVDGRDAVTSQLHDYGMQLGSGTWDFKPSLTYSGQQDNWSWGAQLSGIKRMQNRNRSNYVLGNAFQSTAWGSYRVSNWLSGSIRSVYTAQGAINGEFVRTHSLTSPIDYTSNYGGQFLDFGFGLNLSIPEGSLSRHLFSVEWLQPAITDFNGNQLQREGSLNATWNYAF